MWRKYFIAGSLLIFSLILFLLLFTPFFQHAKKVYISDVEPKLVEPKLQWGYGDGDDRIVCREEEIIIYTPIEITLDPKVKLVKYEENDKLILVFNSWSCKQSPEMPCRTAATYLRLIVETDKKDLELTINDMEKNKTWTKEIMCG